MKACPVRRGTTLVEGLIAVSIGIVVIGGAMFLYLQATRSHTKTTEHASFREEALLVLETINRDLEELVVAAEEVNPRTGKHYAVEPFELGPGSLRFYKYHHTHRAGGQPQVVGQVVEYRTVPREKGVDLMRNGRRVNRQALSSVQFDPLDPVVAYNNIGGSPSGILRVTVVPRGGIWGQMSEDVIARLRLDNKAVSRIHHLVGYESQYTTILWKALTKRQGGVALAPVELAVLADAEARPGVIDGKIGERLKQIKELDFDLDPATVALEDVPFDDATARRFAAFASAPLQRGVGTATHVDRSGFRESGSLSSRVF